MPKAKAQNYEYKLPEDYEMKKETRLKLDALVDECQLTEVQAQRFIDLHVELTEDYVERLQESQSEDRQGKYIPEDDDED